MPPSTAPAAPGVRPPARSPPEASCPDPARQSPGGRAGSRRPPDSGRRALTRASSRATPAPPLPPALAAGQLAARVLEERVREEMKWLLPPVAPGSAPAPGPGPGDLDPRRRRELFRVFTMVQPGGRGPRRARRAPERCGRPARRPGSQGRWSRAGRRARPDAEERGRGQATGGQRTGRRREKASSDRREQCSRPTAQTVRRLRPPQREPSGAAMSAPFSPVLALELRASRLQRRRADKTASGRDRCGALQGQAALP